MIIGASGWKFKVRDMLLQSKKLVNPPNPAGWAGRPSAILLILVAACLAVMFPAYAEQGSEKPTGLMCDLMAMPDRAGIMDMEPEFSWVVPGRERGSAQRAYRIMVASSDELLGDDNPDLWDSGKVASSASTAVEYDGPPLNFNWNRDNFGTAEGGTNREERLGG